MVKELRKKKHGKPKSGPGAAEAGETWNEAKGGDEIDSEDPDPAPQKKKGWLGKLESKLKQVICF
jgi:hypothetical protein